MSSLSNGDEAPAAAGLVAVAFELNGTAVRGVVESRTLLCDFIRSEAGLTGTKVGCEHGVCGACTVQLDGEPVRSCLLFAVQVCDRSVRTVEALDAGGEAASHPLQQAFRECHALQCGFCTPGVLMSLEPLLAEGYEWDDGQIRAALGGNLCRCTGYQNIVAAFRLAAERLGSGSTVPDVPLAARPAPSIEASAGARSR
jgi:aerobic-type carbon monoxide dehydrogenase small subunit (CoxS/CutS family)